MFVKSRNSPKVGHIPHSENNVIIFDFKGFVDIFGSENNFFVFDIDRLNFANVQFGLRQKATEGVYGVEHIKRSTDNFGEHRLKNEVVFSVDDDDFKIGGILFEKFLFTKNVPNFQLYLIVLPCRAN